MRLGGIQGSMTIQEATDGDIFPAYVEQVLCPVRSLHFYVTASDRCQNCIRPVFDPDAAQYYSNVTLSRFLPDTKFGCDITVAHAFCHKQQHFSLPGAQLIVWVLTDHFRNFWR